MLRCTSSFLNALPHTQRNPISSPAACCPAGGSEGIHDLNGLESALAQPRMSFGGEDLYPTLAEKAAAMAFSLIKNHPFVDGNKRTAHAAMETFLVLNGYEIAAPVDEQAAVMLQVAASRLDRDGFTAWLQDHVVER